MYSIDDMFNPVMYQDMLSPSMGFMNPMCGMYPTNMLGGIQMRQQPMQDAYTAIDKKNKESKSNLKSILKALGWMTLGGFIPPARKYIKNAGGLTPAISKVFGSVSKCIKNIF